MNRMSVDKFEDNSENERKNTVISIIKIVFSVIYILFLILMLPIFALYFLVKWLIYRHNLRSSMAASGLPMDVIDDLTGIDFTSHKK